LQGITTASAVSGFWLWSRRLPLPSRVRAAINLMGGVACAQGMHVCCWTLVYVNV
jgi:hypothetical protein